MASVTFQNEGEIFVWEIDGFVDPEDFQLDYFGTLSGIFPEIKDIRSTHLCDVDEFGSFKLADFLGYNTMPEILACLARFGNLIEEHGEAFGYYISDIAGINPFDIDSDTENGFLDLYQGEWDSAEEWGEEYLHDVYGEIPSDNPYLTYNVDMFVRDCSPSLVKTTRYTVHVFTD